MDAIVDLCNEHQIYIVEDCAHAIESIYKGIHCGLGETAFLSTQLKILRWGRWSRDL